MADFLGGVEVPEIVPSGIFPLTPDFPMGVQIAPKVYRHRFGSRSTKTEQRFYAGSGARTFLVGRQRISAAKRKQLEDFWEAAKGGYGAFLFNAPTGAGTGTTEVTCRFANPELTFEQLVRGCASVGVVLVEIPTTEPTYTVTQTLTRFPDATLATTLLNTTHTLIPLVKITPRDGVTDPLHISDRRVNIGAQLYQARLLGWSGISQSIDGATDTAEFVCGNADRVMGLMALGVDLGFASLEFSLFYVQTEPAGPTPGTGIKIDLWRGEVSDWAGDEGPEFSIQASDQLSALTHAYPLRTCARDCWRRFNDVNSGCDFAASGALDLVHFPSADAGWCDKSLDGANGCLAHQMGTRFPGVAVKPQGVNMRSHSQLTGRLTATSITSDTIYTEAIPEIWHDDEENPRKALLAPALIAAGREEDDFYAALGVVCEGPVELLTPSMVTADDTGAARYIGHTLDGQPHHGFGQTGNFGIRQFNGSDPAGATDYFSLGRVGTSPATWREVVDGASVYEQTHSAGTAFIEIRRSDAKGVQVTKLASHEMIAGVAGGLAGYVWTAPGSRTIVDRLTNPVWIAVNMYIRAAGMRYAEPAEQEALFDVAAAIIAGDVCDNVVPRVLGAGSERQFRFKGRMAERKPLRDWLSEVLVNALGYYTWSFGKLRIGLRFHSGSAEGGAFSAGNILLGSLRTSRLKPNFNRLMAEFADEELGYGRGTVRFSDIDHASILGGAHEPKYLDSTIRLAGTFTKSQAARLVTTMVREELGGLTAAERRAARAIAFRTTILALNVHAGAVCSLTHPDLAGGAGEFRVTGWRLNPDYTIDIEGRTATDSMYDMIEGDKPGDVFSGPVPEEAVLDIVPGDVQRFLIDDVAFHVFQSDLAGGEKAIDITYNPPDPIGPFAGVAVYLQGPGDRPPEHAGDFRYNGDPLAIDDARFGTCRLTQPTPAVSETWRIWLASYSLIYRKALVTDPGALGATPWRDIVVEPTSVALVSTPPDNVIPGTPTFSFTGTRDEGGNRMIWVLLPWTAPPDPTATTGVTIYSEIPDQSSLSGLTLGASTLGAGTRTSRRYSPKNRGDFAVGDGEAYLELPEPRETQSWRFYFRPFTERVFPGVVRANQADPTPSVTITIDPRTIGQPPGYGVGSEFAPLITNLQGAGPAGAPVEYRTDWTGAQQFRWVVNWSNPASTDALEYGGVNALVAPVGTGDFSEPARIYYPQTAYVSAWTAVPPGATALRLWMASVDRTGQQNTVVEGWTPWVAATLVYQEGDIGIEVAPNIRALAVASPYYGKNWQGLKVLKLDVSWAVPSNTRRTSADDAFSGATFRLGDVSYGGVVLWGKTPGEAAPGHALTGVIEKSATGFSLEITNFPVVTESWDIYAISVNPNNIPNTYAVGGSNPTPKVTISVSPPPSGGVGTEYSANVTSLAALATYGVNQRGLQTLKIAVTWVEPADTSFQAVVLYAKIAGETYLNDPPGIQLTGMEIGQYANLEIHDFPDVSQTWEIYALTVDATGYYNTYAAATPKVNVTIDPPPLGVANVEYCDNVTSLAVSPLYDTNGRGQRVLKLGVTWIEPNDSKFQGVILYAKVFGTVYTNNPPGIQLTGMTLNESANIEISDFPAAFEQWEIYALSVDVTGFSNTYGASTPQLLIGVNPPPTGTTGVEYCANVTGFFASAVEQVHAADGAVKVKVTCSFTRPTDVTWGGVDIDTQEPTGSTQRTRMPAVSTSPAEFWVEIPTSPQTWKILAVSFDVNGQKNSVDVIGVTPQTSVSVGTTSGKLVISKAALSSYDSTMEVSGTVLRARSIDLNWNNLTTQLNNEYLSGGIRWGLVSIDNASGRKSLVGGGRMWSLNPSNLVVISIEVGAGGEGLVSIMNAAGGTRMLLNGSTGRLTIDGSEVLGSRRTTVANPTGGGVIDAECRARLVELLDRLRAASGGHGLIA